MAPTQVSIITVVPDAQADLLNGSTKTGEMVRQAIGTVLKQEGAHKAHYGASIEKPEHLWVFLAYNNITNNSQRANATIEGQLSPIVDSAGVSFTSHFDPSPSSIFNNPEAPFVEVFRAFFPSNTDAATKANIYSLWNDFADKGLRSSGLPKGIALGWSDDTDAPVPGDADGKKGAVLTALISWSSLESHEEAAGMKGFKDNMGIVLGLPGMIGMDLIHVKCVTKSREDFA